jgi:hypothetical protein
MSSTTTPQETTQETTCYSYNDKNNWPIDPLTGVKTSSTYTINQVCSLFDKNCEVNTYTTSPHYNKCWIECTSKYPSTCTSGQGSVMDAITNTTSQDEDGCYKVTYTCTDCASITNPSSSACSKVGCYYNSDKKVCSSIQDNSSSSSSECSVTPSPVTTDNVAADAKAMGMDQTCTTAADSQAGSFQASYGAKIPFGGRVSGSASATFQNSSASTSGCSNALLQVSDYDASKFTQQCILNNLTADSTTTLNANSTISFITLPRTAIDEAMYEAVLTTLTNLSQSKYADTCKNLIDKLTISATNLSDRNINITGSKITNSASVEIKQITSVNAAANSQLITNATDQVKAVATQSLQQTLGVNSLPTNTKQLINSKVNQKQQQINDSISNAIATSNITANGTAGFTITSSGSINITDTDIDQNLLLKIMAETMAKSAVTIGTQVASDIISDVSSNESMDQTVKGQEDLAAALGKSNSDAIGETVKAGTSSDNSWIFIIIGIVLLLSVGGVIFKVIQSKGGSGGSGGLSISPEMMSKAAKFAPVPSSVPKLSSFAVSSSSNNKAIFFGGIFVFVMVIVVILVLVFKNK